jgi:hypothetical protein
MADVLDLMSLEVNIPSRDFGTYCTSLSAPPKYGKSEFCTKFDKPLIFDFEEGTKGKVVYRVQVTTWQEVKKYVKQLTKEPKLKEKYKTICFDTTNYALEACKQYVMAEYQANNPEKLIDTFNKIPYGGAHELLSKEFKATINSLKKAGYGIVLVSHVKDKTFDKDSEQEHTKTVPDLSDRERNLISAMADFLLLGEFELETLSSAEFDGKGKVIKEAIVKTNRVLYLRTNEEAEAGFRWEDVPERIPFDYDTLQEVFIKAVDNEIKTGKKKFGLSDEKAEEIRERLDEQKIQEEQEAFEYQDIEELKSEIIALIRSKKDEGVKVSEIKNCLDGLSVKEVNSLADIDRIKTILDNLNSL